MKKTSEELLTSYKNGQRIFEGIEFDNCENLQGVNLSDSIFIKCYFTADFQKANLSNSQFIECNLKTADFSSANLTGASIKNCAVCSTNFKGAIIPDFSFDNNHSYGVILNQNDLEKLI